MSVNFFNSYFSGSAGGIFLSYKPIKNIVYVINNLSKKRLQNFIIIALVTSKAFLNYYKYKIIFTIYFTLLTAK